MKTPFAILVIVIAVLACGCTAAAPATGPVASHAETTVAAIPDLTGTWTGPMQGYDEGTGFSDYSAMTATLAITEQHGRIFAGHIVFTVNGTESVSGLAGVISGDGRTFSIAEKDSGYAAGTMVSADEIELTYLQDHSPYSVAIDSYKRV
jgi:hypothetical protein